MECNQRACIVLPLSSLDLPANEEGQNPSSIRIGSYLSKQAEAQETPPERLVSGLEPTQRLSDVCNITPARLLDVVELIGAGPPFWSVFALTPDMTAVADTMLTCVARCARHWFPSPQIRLLRMATTVV